MTSLENIQDEYIQNEGTKPNVYVAIYRTNGTRPVNYSLDISRHKPGSNGSDLIWDAELVDEARFKGSNAYSQLYSAVFKLGQRHVRIKELIDILKENKMGNKSVSRLEGFLERFISETLAGLRASELGLKELNTGTYKSRN